jgi:hypothetical protein
MQGTEKPMPPNEQPAASDVTTLETWVKAGMPQGTCAQAEPTSTPEVCTSGKTWTRNNHGSSSMHPGVACINCHETRGPRFTFAGTVFPTAHEPDDCNGLSGVTVTVTDANGRTVTATSNSAGNFDSNRSLTPPLHVTVSKGGKTRAMSGAVSNGDCNTCHTESGAQEAPGRIMSP